MNESVVASKYQGNAVRVFGEYVIRGLEDYHK